MRNTFLLVTLLAAAVLGWRMRGADTLVIYSGKQQRLTPPLSCWRCDTLDLETGRLPRRRYEIVILDGHSTPPDDILNGSVERVAAALRLASPRLVVAWTCYGSELSTLEHLFASPSTMHVLAAPATLSWKGLKVHRGCVLAHGPLPQCFSVPPEMHRFRRTDLAPLRAEAERMRTRVRACDAELPFVRIRPRYLCLDEAAAPPALLAVESHEINTLCHPSAHPVGVRRCGRPDRVPANAAAPAL